MLCIGPEASGTRLLTRLVNALEGIEAVHRSLPHGRAPEGHPQWPELDMGQDATVLIIRNGPELEASQLDSRHTTSALQTWHRMPDVLALMARAAGDAPTRLVTYEGLVARPEMTMDWLADWLGAPRLTKLPEEVRDGNVRRARGLNHGR